jgi:hypothetical protein
MCRGVSRKVLANDVRYYAQERWIRGKDIGYLADAETLHATQTRLFSIHQKQLYSCGFPRGFRYRFVRSGLRWRSMGDEIIKRPEEAGAVQAIQALLTLSGDEALSIIKTGVKGGLKGLGERGISLLQYWNGQRFGQSFLNVVQEMIDEGQVRPDFHTTDAGTSTLHEFFEFIDGKPDEDRFRVFCALFMSANSPDADYDEAVLDTELMGILRQLSAAEMHLLSAIMTRPSYKVADVHNLRAWLAKGVTHDSESLLSRNMDALLKEGLVDRNTWEHPGGTPQQERHLLSDLGTLLLTRVKKYNEFKSGLDSKKAT